MDVGVRPYNGGEIGPGACDDSFYEDHDRSFEENRDHDSGRGAISVSIMKTIVMAARVGLSAGAEFMTP